MTLQTRWMSRVCLILGLTALVAGPATSPLFAQEEADGGSYGYLSVVEGSATVIQAGQAGAKDGTPADVNQPVLAGDRLWVDEGSKVEIVLADRNIVRLDGGSELLLEHLAESPDADDPTTVLRLLEGNMQVVVTSDSLGDELPRLETPNATILPQDFGTYRVTTSDGSWSEVTVRRGKAEVIGDGDSEDDSEIVGADESAVIEGGGDGDERASIEVDDASGVDGLERWAQRMDENYRQADVRYVDSDLRYSASSLNRHGSWVTVENERYWRPQVAADWRPYWHGRWAYTPSGMTWVSYEPWGWVPYHYGSWDYVSSYGWLWRPGRVYSPAWVYWYWGSDYTGWCPIGYYTHYYSARFGGPGFRHGVYGWAGGDWGLYARWNFVSTSYFRGYRDGYRNGYWDGRHDRGWRGWRDQRDVRRYAVPNDQRRGGHALGRGIITTDTRRLTPDTLGDPRRAVQVLSNQPHGRRNGDRGDNALTDVTPFIARRPDLPTSVTQVLRSDDRDHRIDGTPLRPSTLGRGDRNARSGREPGAPVPGSGRDGARTPRMGRSIPGDRQADDSARTPRMGRSIPGNQGGGAPRPDRNERPSASDDSARSPRMGRSIPGNQGGGAPRPDRNERPSASDDGARSPRMGRSIPGSQGGGAPRPDRSERPSASDDGGRSPRMGRSIPGNQGGGSPRPDRNERPVIRSIPDRREVPQRRQMPERPTYQRVDPPPSRSYGDQGDSRGGRSRGASERPAYDPPRPTYDRPVQRERAPQASQRPAPDRSNERSARPRSERPPERQDGGRERSRSSEDGGGRRGNGRRGDHGDHGGR